MKIFFKTLCPHFLLACFSILIINIQLPNLRIFGFTIAAFLLMDAAFYYFVQNKTALAKHRKLYNAFTVFHFLLPLWIAFIIAAIVFFDFKEWNSGLRLYSFGILSIYLLLKLYFYAVAGVYFLLNCLNKSWAKKYTSYFPYLMIFFGICAAFLLYSSFYTVHHFKLKKIEISSQKIPKSFNGYKILQFSDLHIGSFQRQASIEKLLRLINQSQADLVVFTGDMVNFRSSEIEAFIPILQQIQAKDGVYVIKGNHDYGSYLNWDNPQDSLDNIRLLDKVYTSMGWHSLHNESVYLYKAQDSILLGGCESWGALKRYPKLADLEKTFADKNTEQYTILLSHDPKHFDSIVSKQAPFVNLCLSGHTHGMQAGFPWQDRDITLADVTGRFVNGLYKISPDQSIYVSTGCGFNGLPFRLGLRPSVSLIELKALN